MKKNIVIASALVIASMVLLPLIRHRAQKQNFTLEWIEITPQTYASLRPTLDALRPVYIEAFLPLMKPYVYAYDPRLQNLPQNLPVEKLSTVEQHVVAGITKVLKTDWDKDMTQLQAPLKSKEAAITYAAIAKDNRQKVLGFALLTETPQGQSIRDYLDSRLVSISEGSTKDISPETRDQTFVTKLAVTPSSQGMGIGKALIFAIFDHCPRIKKVYLTTSANQLNKKAQTFYEHIGFRCVLKGTVAPGAHPYDLDRDVLVYRYESR